MEVVRVEFSLNAAVGIDTVFFKLREDKNRSSISLNNCNGLITRLRIAAGSAIALAVLSVDIAEVCGVPVDKI